MSPLDSIIKWYESLPIRHREDIGFLIIGLNYWLSDIDVSLDSDFCIKLVERLKEAGSSSPFSCAGLVLALREQLGGFILIGRNQDEHERAAELKDMISRFEEKGNISLADKMREKLQSNSFKSRQWQETCAKWNILVSSNLTNSLIRSWVNEQTIFNRQS